MKHKIVCFAFSLALLALGGVSCATRPYSSYQSSPVFLSAYGKAFCDTNLKGKRVVVLPASEPANKLEYHRVATYFKNSLSSQGYIIVNEDEKADVVVFLEYGTGEPKERMWITSTPIIGTTGGGIATVNTTTSIYGSLYNSIGTAYSSQTIITPMRTGVVGNTVSTHYSTTYTHFATLNAMDMGEFDKKGKMVEKWNAKVYIKGDISDFYVLSPWLAVAAGRLAGVEQPVLVEIEMSSKDPDWFDVNGIKRVILNTNANAYGVFKRYTAYQLAKNTNAVVAKAIENALQIVGLEAKGEFKVNVDFHVSGKNLYIELKDPASNQIVGAATEPDLGLWKRDWNETANYVVKLIGRRTMCDWE